MKDPLRADCVNTLRGGRRPALRLLNAAGALAFLMVCAVANADDDHERARDAVRAGEILPLGDVLARLPRSMSGNILEAELDREDGSWIYEITVLRADGQLIRLEVDAANANVLRTRARRGKRDRHRRDD